MGQFTQISILLVIILAGCSQNSDVKLDCSKDPVRLTLVNKTNPTDCTLANGQISVAVLGGAGEYELTIGNLKTTDLNFQNLEAETYKIVAKDKLGCKDSLEVILQAPISQNLTWSTQLRPVFVANCVKSNCHAGTGRGDFSKYSDVNEYLNGIKRRVASGSMPPDNRLSKDQIRLVVCWIDAGAREN